MTIFTLLPLLLALFALGYAGDRFFAWLGRPRPLKCRQGEDAPLRKILPEGSRYPGGRLV